MWTCHHGYLLELAQTLHVPNAHIGGLDYGKQLLDGGANPLCAIFKGIKYLSILGIIYFIVVVMGIHQHKTSVILCYVIIRMAGTLLITWFNFNPSMVKVVLQCRGLLRLIR